MKPELHILLRRQAVLLQLLVGDVPVEILDANREVIDDTRWTLVAKRYHRPLHPQAEDLIRLVLADKCHPEDTFVERGRSLQVVHENRHVVDPRATEAAWLRGLDTRGARHPDERRDSLNQLPAGQRAVLEAAHEIVNDRLHRPSSLVYLVGTRRFSSGLLLER